MPKIDLDKVTLGVSPLTNTVFAGVSKKNPRGPGLMWLSKKDVTQDFLGAVIQRWENQKEIIQSGKDKWEISVKKL